MNKPKSDPALMARLLEAGYTIEEAVALSCDSPVDYFYKRGIIRDLDLEEEAAAQLSYTTNGGPQ